MGKGACGVRDVLQTHGTVPRAKGEEPVTVTKSLRGHARVLYSSSGTCQIGLMGNIVSIRQAMTIDMEPKIRLSADSFEALKQDGSLRWEVQSANWQYMRSVLDTEDTLQKTDQNLHDLLLDIGQTVVDDDSPDPMDVTKAQELQNKFQRLELQCNQITDQMRAAMREKLTSMLPLGCVERISEDQLETFFDELENATHVQMRIGRMLDSGLKQIKARSEDSDDSARQ